MRRKEILTVSLFVFVAVADLFLRIFLLERSEWPCNRGVFWGIELSFWPMIFFGGVLLTWIGKLTLEESDKKRKFWLTLVFLGGLINLVDRLAYGCVLDYFNWPGYLATALPHFNIADSFIVLGCSGLLLSWMKHGSGMQQPSVDNDDTSS